MGAEKWLKKLTIEFNVSNLNRPSFAADTLELGDNNYLALQLDSELSSILGYNTPGFRSNSTGSVGIQKDLNRAEIKKLSKDKFYIKLLLLNSSYQTIESEILYFDKKYLLYDGDMPAKFDLISTGNKIEKVKANCNTFTGPSGERASYFLTDVSIIDSAIKKQLKVKYGDSNYIDGGFLYTPDILALPKNANIQLAVVNGTPETVFDYIEINSEIYKKLIELKSNSPIEIYPELDPRINLSDFPDIKFYDSSGAAKSVTTGVFYDSSGNAKNIKAVYYYDASGNLKKVV